MKGTRLLGVCALVLTAGYASAQSLEDLADQCEAAVSAADQVKFDDVASRIIKRQDVFDTALRERLEDCLTDGHGEPWEYDWPAGAFMSSAAVEAKLREAEVEKGRKARAAAQAAQAEADLQTAKARNAARVAELVYASCSALLVDNQVAAMTNQLCVESFLANGLPEP